MLAQIDRNLHQLYQFCGWLAAGFVVLIACLVLVNIVSRIFGVFVPGMTEGAGYSMAAAGALGLAYTFGEQGHIRVSMLARHSRGSTRHWLELWVLAVSAGLSCYLAYYLVRMVLVSYDFEDRSDGSDELLIWIPQVPMVVGFVVFAIALVHALVVGWFTGKTNEELSDESDQPNLAGH